MCKAACECPHGHDDCPLTKFVDTENEHVARNFDTYGRKVNRCEKCNDSGWVPTPPGIGFPLYQMPCDCPVGEQVWTSNAKKPSGVFDALSALQADGGVTGKAGGTTKPNG